MEGIFGNPAFLFTFAVIQAAVLLVAVRYIDAYDRQPLALVALVAAWGATGAAALSIAGNEAVRGLLSGDLRLVFGDAIAPPLVEEAAKGVALLVAVGPVRRLARRAGVTLFADVGAGIVYGAAVGIGFAFTEDVSYLVDAARSSGVDAGFATFVDRRDFFGPAILHHAVFTAAFGGGLGYAASTHRRSLRIAVPLAAFAAAVALHAVNNGLVEFVLVLRYGVEQTAAWVLGTASTEGVAATAETMMRLLRVIDFAYLLIVAVGIAHWAAHRRRIVLAELEEEVDSGLVDRDDVSGIADRGRRVADDLELLRAGQFERWRHQRRVRATLGRLALLKHRSRGEGGDWSRVQRARRELATLATYEVAPFTVPAVTGALIGRDEELDALEAFVARSGARAVTLTGPGGTGKTRLAIEVATRLRHRYAGGVVFVDLAPIIDPALVPAVVARALDVVEEPDATMLETLKHALRDRHLLLVLDNVEQVMAAAPAIAELLAAAPRLVVLATSREPLRIAAEHEWAVAPLALPAPATIAAPDVLAANAAVRLFAERARAVHPGFRLTPDNARAVAEICIRLDGLPLAIELAAARIGVLSPQAILERLGDRLAVLSGGGRDLPHRHQALRSTIDWSHDMLEASERALFARLGVFAGGATLGAVEAVSDGDVLDDLASLVGKSLVRRVDDPGGEPRFAMLETIRAYALERLAERAELEEVRTRHLAYHATLAEAAERELTGAHGPQWLTRLDAELANLRAALAWSADSGQLEPGLRIAGALPRYTSMRGWTEMPAWLSAALERSDEVPADVRARAVFADGYAALDHGDYERARKRFEAGLQRFRELGDERGAAACLAQLSWLHVAGGRHEQAEGLGEESVRLARRAGDRHVESVALAALAGHAEQAGDLGRARELHERSLVLRRELGDRRNVANALLNLARVDLLAGVPEQADERIGEALELAREVGDAWGISLGLATKGRLALARGDDEAAAELYRQALEATMRRRGIRLAAECLDGLAGAAVAHDPFTAARLLGAAEGLRRRLGVGAPAMGPEMHGRLRARAQAALGDGFAEIWAAGLSLDTDAAVDEALQGARAPASGAGAGAQG